MKTVDILIALCALAFSGASFVHRRETARRRKAEEDHGPWWF